MSPIVFDDYYEKEKVPVIQVQLVNIPDLALIIWNSLLRVPEASCW